MIFHSGMPTPDEVRAQLSRMMASKDFQAPERLKGFLSFVVEETLVGNAQNIKAYTIALAAFGRNKDFDPQLDPIVRIEAGKLRKILDLYFYGHPEDKVQISIPKGTYVPTFAYSQAGNNVTSEEPAQTEEEAFPVSSEIPSIPVMQNSVLEKEESPILMVLPFSMRSKDEELKFFLSSLTDNLLAQIQRNEVVRVMEAPVHNIPDINQLNIVQFAKEQGVRFVLHGQAHTTDTSIRIYVALTDAQKGLRIWADKYDSPINTGNFEAQEKITQSIFSTVLDSVGVISRTMVQETSYLAPDELGVYESTLRYIDWVTSFDRESYSKARQALELNIVKDPHNPIMLSQLSDIYSSDYQFAFNHIHNNLEMALDLAKRALIIDPSCHMAQLAKALYFFLIRNKQQLEQLLAGLPEQNDVNPYITASIGLFAGMSIDLEEGKRLIENATKLNPYQPSSYNVVPFMYHFTKKDYEEALKYALLINAPSCVWDPMILAVAHIKGGQKAEAEKARKRLFSLEPQFDKKRSQLLYGLFFDDQKVKLIDEALKEAGI